MKLKLLIALGILLLIPFSNIRAEETIDVDGAIGSMDSGYVDDVDPDPFPELEEEPLQGEVINESENYYQESVSSNNSSDQDSGQLSDMVQMLHNDLVTYMNFSYKMQICTVAILALIAGGSVAIAIFDHFTK